jgi:Superfamily II DNA/RNA helicases, SNF2 family
MSIETSKKGENNFALQALTQATSRLLYRLDPIATDVLAIGYDPRFERFIVDLETTSKVNWHRASQAGHALFERTHERTWTKRKPEQYLVPATMLNVLIIYHSWPGEQIKFRDEEAKAVYTARLLDFHRYDKRCRQVAAFKLEGVLPELPEYWKEHPDYPLSPYQRMAVLFGLGARSSAIFADRGTGKTVIGISAICTEVRRQKKCLHVLVICPPQVVDNWLYETRRFTTLRGKVAIVRGTKQQRLTTYITNRVEKGDCDFTLTIVSYDTAKQDTDILTAFPWDLGIYDETHVAKSPETKRWRKLLLPLRDHIPQIIGLTGSPIGNSHMDLWTQLEALGTGCSGFKSYASFRSFFGQWEALEGGHGVERLSGLKNIPVLHELLARMAFQITKKEAGLNLPDKQYEIHTIEMGKEQTRLYEQMKENLAAEIEDKLTGNITEIQASNILTKLLRLSQITSGYYTVARKVDEESGKEIQPKSVHEISEVNPKIEACLERILSPDRDEGAKTVVWCHWKQNCQQLSKVLTEKGIVHGVYNGDTNRTDRTNFVKRFNLDPEFKVLIANPQTAAEGLNLLGYDYMNSPPRLTTNCDEMLVFSQGWSSILRGQLEDRAHRRGTRVPVRIVDIVVPGSIDTEIMEKVQGKADLAAYMLDIRDILKRVL